MGGNPVMQVAQAAQVKEMEEAFVKEEKEMGANQACLSFFLLISAIKNLPI